MNNLVPVVGEPPLDFNELSNARLFDHQMLKGVVLWSVNSLGTRHWRTGFEFAGLPTVVSDAAQGPPQPSTLMSQTVRPGVYGGVSVDMFQPLAHQYHVEAVDGKKNLHGRLSISPRLNGFLFSRSRNLFSCSLKFKVPVRMKDVLDLILAQGRQFYKFNPKGSGCLYWQLLLLEAFVVMGWIDRTSLDAANVQITALASRADSGVPYPPVMGTFYRPPQRL